jgi:hypothetical protein
MVDFFPCPGSLDFSVRSLLAPARSLDFLKGQVTGVKYLF